MMYYVVQFPIWNIFSFYLKNQIFAFFKSNNMSEFTMDHELYLYLLQN